MTVITAVAPVNIAVIKYWGKRNEELILPLNDSFSTTLDLKNMFTKTTVMLSPDFVEDKFWLNGKEENFNNPRLLDCLKELKRRVSPEDAAIASWKVHIASQNTFPTAAGLASSAAGFACLVYALAAIYHIQGDISAVARRGSGSACRSMYGGWVLWKKGTSDDGSDSIATPIFPSSYWPELRILVLVVNDDRKKQSSTSGMLNSTKTSTLLKYRVTDIVPTRVNKIIEAVRQKDFETFATITMQDSNQFHAICMDTFPPCVYMNDVSHAIVNMVHTYNDFKGSPKLAYTFDAGPNAVLYAREADIPEVIALINHKFPTTVKPSEYYRGLPLKGVKESKVPVKTIALNPYKENSLKYIIYTQVGDGPKLLTNSKEHLLDAHGLPKK